MCVTGDTKSEGRLAMASIEDGARRMWWRELRLSICGMLGVMVVFLGVFC